MKQRGSIVGRRLYTYPISWHSASPCTGRRTVESPGQWYLALSFVAVH
jgi:hypothetical protein